MDGDSYRHRRSVRLTGYDYRRPARYFVTIVTAGRLELFGEIIAGKVRLNILGREAAAEWLRTPQLRPAVKLHDFVVMPSHLHAIVEVGGNTAESTSDRDEGPLDMGGRPLVSRSLGAIVRGYKAAATRRLNEARGTPGGRVWQRNYHERIIRSRQELAAIRQYIRQNPARWHADPENLAGVPDAWERSFWKDTT